MLFFSFWRGAKKCILHETSFKNRGFEVSKWGTFWGPFFDPNRISWIWNWSIFRGHFLTLFEILTMPKVWNIVQKRAFQGSPKRVPFWDPLGSSFVIKWGPRRVSLGSILIDFWFDFWTLMSSFIILRWACGEPAASLWNMACPPERCPYFIKRRMLQQYAR